MRVVRTLFAILLLALAVFAYFQWTAESDKLPPEVDKLLNDPDSGAAALTSNVQPAKVTAPISPAPTPAPLPAAIPSKTIEPATATVAIPAPPKPWTPPATMPVQDNWTWETSDGKTYQDVVVTKIEPTSVTIMHSLGVAHVPIESLSPEIQKKLNYDPAAAAAARAESRREMAHPYYTMASLKEAQKEAHTLNWPLAWMCSELADLNVADPASGSEEDLTQMALNHLKSRSVVIFLDGNADLPALSPLIRDQQLFQLDDGPISGGHHFYGPKIVFSDPDVTKAFGRVSHTQMAASREAAIDAVFATIPQSQVASVPATGPAESASAPATVPASPSAVPTSVTTPAGPSSSPASAAPAPTAALPSSAPQPWAPPDVMPAQPAWTWETSDGKTYLNVVVTKIEAKTVSITHSLGVAHIPIFLLPPDIQEKLNYDPHALAQIPALIAHKLVSSDGTAVTAPEASVRYFAIYYSAQWCPPCHAFTPRLVQWYNKFKPGHLNFELIFVSEDHNEDAMHNYMKEMAMPWPAIRFAELRHDGRNTFRGSDIEKFAGDGIPDLVLVDAGGNILSDSYQDGTYVGPEKVVDDINKLVGGASPVPLASRIPSGRIKTPVLVSGGVSSTGQTIPLGI